MTEFLIGGYTADMGGVAQGISRARSHPDGRFEFLGLVVETDSPAWLVVADEVVHAALERASELTSFRLSDSTLQPLARVAAGGSSPCSLVVAQGSLIAACYGDGVVTVTALDDSGAATDSRAVIAGFGSGPLAAQEGPHAHAVYELASGRLLSLDLGADRLHVHEWVDGALERVDSVALPAGSGPRDVLELPGGELAVLAEWGCELLILEPVGDAFEVGQILPLPGATPGEDQAAALGLSPDGRHLYAGIRGADRIAMIALDADGARALGWMPSGGSWPRHLIVDAGVLEHGAVHVANQLSSTVASFRIGPDGILTPLAEPVAVPSPNYLLALPTA